MNNASIYKLAVVSALFIFVLHENLYSFDVDGNLSDWGVTPGSDFQPNAGIFSWVEDFTDYSNSGYVGPGYGGQPFDIEAMYASINNGNLYVAIVAGMPPYGSGPKYSANETPRSSPYYYPGDIGFDLDGDGFFEFGLETTGRSDNTLDGYAGNGEYSYNSQLKGNLYRINNTAGWNKGLDLSGFTPAEINYRQPLSLELLYNTTVIYIQTADPSRYVIETSVPLSILNPVYNIDWTIHWTLTCGNDIANLIVNFSVAENTVPEPMSAFILAIGLMGNIARKFIAQRLKK